MSSARHLGGLAVNGSSTPLTAESSMATTPASERSEEDVVVTASTTVTTNVSRQRRASSAARNRPDGRVANGTDDDDDVEGDPISTKQYTTRITHIGARGVDHVMGKDGAVTLKPKPSSRKRNRKMRALVSFKARESMLGRFGSGSEDPFRGFYTLFWLALALLMLSTFYHSWSKTGQLFSLTFATLLTKDAGILALSDGILIGSLFICVVFAKVLKRGWVSYWPTLVIVQHLWQAALLGAVIKWSHIRDWPWVQSGFFCLHTICMMMKIHSYMTVNGTMADNWHLMARMERKLERRLAEIEGIPDSQWEKRADRVWDEAVKTAKEKANSAPGARPELAFLGEHKKEAAGGGGGSKATPLVEPFAERYKDQADGGWNSRLAQRGTNSRRHLANYEERQLHPVVATPSPRPDGKRRPHTHEGRDVNAIQDPHPLAGHPDAEVAALAQEIEQLREDLLQIGTIDGDARSQPVSWPDNITYANFWDFLLVPTLVYELSYPRTKTIRPLYVLEKVLATFGTFFVIYIITEHWIMPHQPGPDTPKIQTFLDLAVPMMVNYLLIFYLMFEGVCAGFAELTRFADREFYQDFWNSTSMDVFSRKWNKPVHMFLLRHVYASSISAGASRSGAMFITFLLSSLLHELVMAIVSGKIRGYLFAMQMAQMPLILLSQVPIIKKNWFLGNLTFWLGLFIGFPLLNIAYISF